MSKPSLSVIFITKNEEFHIGNAIDNVRDFAEEIFVVDSGSTDKTVEVAESKGAKVLFHAFEGFGKQWNWALDNCPVKTAWTMKMDPDERLSDELEKELVKELETAGDYEGFSLVWCLFFLGKRLGVGTHPFLRVWRTGSCRFTDVLVNEHPVVSGKIKQLKGRLLHLDSKDFHSWVEKQNRYTSQEAIMRYQGESHGFKPRLFGSRQERAAFLAIVFHHLPLRFLWLTLYYFVFKGAWRAGKIGWQWAVARSFVTRMIEYKYQEMLTTGRLVAS